MFCMRAPCACQHFLCVQSSTAYASTAKYVCVLTHGTGNAQSSSCACRAQGCVRVHKKKEGPATFEWACIDDIITGESNRRESNRRELVSPMGEQSWVDAQQKSRWIFQIEQDRIRWLTFGRSV